MTPKQFEEAGRTLFGPEWQSRMARAMAISVSQVRAYKIGPRHPSKRGMVISLRSERHVELMLASPEMAQEWSLSDQEKHRLARES